jgi:histidyl-tRNA synthetase
VDAETYLDPTAKLEKQIKYADGKGIPYVVILGPDEIKENKVTIKNMKTGGQEMVNRKDLVNFQFSNTNLFRFAKRSPSEQ